MVGVALYFIKVLYFQGPLYSNTGLLAVSVMLPAETA